MNAYPVTVIRGASLPFSGRPAPGGRRPRGRGPSAGPPCLVRDFHDHHRGVPVRPEADAAGPLRPTHRAASSTGYRIWPCANTACPSSSALGTDQTRRPWPPVPRAASRRQLGPLASSPPQGPAAYRCCAGYSASTPRPPASPELGRPRRSCQTNADSDGVARLGSGIGGPWSSGELEAQLEAGWPAKSLNGCRGAQCHWRRGRRQCGHTRRGSVGAPGTSHGPRRAVRRLPPTGAARDVGTASGSFITSIGIVETPTICFTTAPVTGCRRADGTVCGVAEPAVRRSVGTRRRISGDSRLRSRDGALMNRDSPTAPSRVAAELAMATCLVY
jgi:hypothetical protein